MGVHHTIESCEPELVAPDTWLVRQLSAAGAGGDSMFVNSSVITGAEPVLVDCGPAASRSTWMDAVASIVELSDVRWIFLSHDDVDHVGNLLPVLDACPRATVVTTWFMAERLSAEHGISLPFNRMRWVNDGGRFSAGDRELVACTPPTFDGPTTRGLFDTATGVYWAADSFGAPVPGDVRDIDELDRESWRDGFTAMQRLLRPVDHWLDPVRSDRHLRRVRALGAKVITSAHGPALRGRQIDEAFDILGDLMGGDHDDRPDGQRAVEAVMAAMTVACGPPDRGHRTALPLAA